MEEEKVLPGLDEVLDQITDPEPTPTPDPVPDPTPDPEVDPAPEADPQPDPEADPEADPGADDDKDSTVIKGMRASYRTEKTRADINAALIEKAAKNANLTVEEYTAKLEEDADKAEAEAKGVSPEVAKQLREQDTKIKQMEESQKRENFLKNIGALEKVQTLSGDQLKSFVTDAGAAGFDLGNPNVSFEAIYFALNHDSFEKTTREDERQKVYAEIELQKKQSPANSRTGVSGDVGKGNLDDFLKNVKL